MSIERLAALDSRLSSLAGARKLISIAIWDWEGAPPGERADKMWDKIATAIDALIAIVGTGAVPSQPASEKEQT